MNAENINVLEALEPTRETGIAKNDAINALEEGVKSKVLYSLPPKNVESTTNSEAEANAAWTNHFGYGDTLYQKGAEMYQVYLDR